MGGGEGRVGVGARIHVQFELSSAWRHSFRPPSPAGARPPTSLHTPHLHIACTMPPTLHCTADITLYRPTHAYLPGLAARQSGRVPNDPQRAAGPGEGHIHAADVGQEAYPTRSARGVRPAARCSGWMGREGAAR